MERLRFVTEKLWMVMETAAHSKRQFTFTEVVKTQAGFKFAEHTGSRWCNFAELNILNTLEKRWLKG